MPETTLDRAARALEHALGQEVSGLPPQVYVDATKRVLKALREPGEKAINWGTDAVKALAGDSERAAAESAWRAMIDATLEGG
jgi:hypothetical protein